MVDCFLSTESIFKLLIVNQFCELFICILNKSISVESYILWALDQQMNV